MADSQTGAAVYRRLLTYALPYWTVFLPAILGMVLYAATEPGMAALIKPMVDGSLIEQDPKMIRTVPLLFVGLFIVRGVASFMSTYFTRWVGRKVIADLRAEMFFHLLRLPSQYYDSTSSGLLLSQLIYNVEQVAQATANAITILIRDTITIIGLLLWMLYLNVLLAMIFVVIGPLIAGAVRYVSKRFRRISRNIQHSMGQVTHAAEETIEAHRVVKAFGGREYEAAHFSEINEKNRRLHMKMILTDAASVPLIQLISASALAGIIYLASVESVSERISPGAFVSFITAMGMLLSPIKRLTRVNALLQRGIAAGQSIFSLLDVEAEKDQGTLRLQRAEGKIELRNVSLTYNEDKGAVLQEINLSIEPGQTVAFVGRSGSGKSSLVNLLPRFYEPTEGAVLIDGHDARELSLDNLRGQIAIVSQEVMLFNDTIARNIAYGAMRHHSRDEIVQVARAAHAMEFIEPLPDGLDTFVGENGVLLSGGQRQRIAIARAMLKNAPLLILDEATSALDTESERLIQAALERLMKQRTTLVIAHRLSTIENADVIVVLDAGRIVESGSHGELLVLGGHYANLHQMQFHDACAEA